MNNIRSDARSTSTSQPPTHLKPTEIDDGTEPTQIRVMQYLLEQTAVRPCPMLVYMDSNDCGFLSSAEFHRTLVALNELGAIELTDMETVESKPRKLTGVVFPWLDCQGQFLAGRGSIKMEAEVITRSKRQLVVMRELLQQAGYFPGALPMFGKQFTVPPISVEDFHSVLLGFRHGGVIQLLSLEIEGDQGEAVGVILPWLESHRTFFSRCPAATDEPEKNRPLPLSGHLRKDHQ